MLERTSNELIRLYDRDGKSVYTGQLTVERNVWHWPRFPKVLQFNIYYRGEVPFYYTGKTEDYGGMDFHVYKEAPLLVSMGE